MHMRGTTAISASRCAPGIGGKLIITVVLPREGHLNGGPEWNTDGNPSLIRVKTADCRTGYSLAPSFGIAVVGNGHSPASNGPSAYNQEREDTPAKAAGCAGSGRSPKASENPSGPGRR